METNEASEDTGIIRNANVLTSHGNTEGRKILLDIIDAGLKAADPYSNTRKLLRIKDGKLFVGHKDFDSSGKSFVVFDLSKIKNIYVIGGGKAVHNKICDFTSAHHSSIFLIASMSTSSANEIPVTFAALSDNAIRSVRSNKSRRHLRAPAIICISPTFTRSFRYE